MSRNKQEAMQYFNGHFTHITSREWTDHRYNGYTVYRKKDGKVDDGDLRIARHLGFGSTMIVTKLSPTDILIEYHNPTQH